MDAELPQSDLESQVESLSRLLQHLNSVRAQDPPTNTSISYQLRASHDAAKAFVTALGSPSMQVALNRAQELEAADSTFVPLDRDEQDRYDPKRRKIDKTSLQARTNSVGNGHVTPLLLPPASDDAPHITTSTLPDYLRTLRSTKPNLRLHIWLSERPSATPPTIITSPVILKVSIPNLFVVYITLVEEETPSHSSPDAVLRPQKMVVLGPREKRLPHMQSEFSIFRNMSQTLMRVISETPAMASPSSGIGSSKASLPQLIDLISTYDKLFTDQCCVCQKNMSREGHLPPLERLWTPQSVPLAEDRDKPPSPAERSKSSTGGRWVARHAGCQ